MSRSFLLVAAAFCVSAVHVTSAQTPAATAVVVPSPADQIAAAVTALPEEMRAGAAVLGYVAVGKPLVTLREGKNDMICLAPDPAAKAFHSACYHKGMEAFMLRGRQLREQGITGAQVDTVRFAEVKAGKLVMPTKPTMLYQIFGGSFDPVTSKVTGGNALFVTYIPFATPETTGLSAKATKDGPWIMFPGTPKAHIMFTGRM